MASRKSGHVTAVPREDRRLSPTWTQPSREAAPELADGLSSSAQGLMQLQRAVGNQAVVHLLQGAGALIVQRDWYEFGAANVVPHIHNYGGGCHLKISDPERPGEPVRIDLVKNGKRIYDNVAYAFRLARATGDTVLVDAIKSSIRGTK